MQNQSYLPQMHKSNCGRPPPTLNRLSDNSISGKKDNEKKGFKTFKSKRRNPVITVSNCRTSCKGRDIRDPLRSHSNKINLDTKEVKKPVNFI